MLRLPPGFKWPQGSPPTNNPSKYRNRRASRVGFNFDSEKEAKYFDQLTLRQRSNDIIGFLWQVPIRIPGGVTYWADFLVIEKDGSLHFIDTKGVRTPMFKTKKRLVEHHYPWIQIEER